MMPIVFGSKDEPQGEENKLLSGKLFFVGPEHPDTSSLYHL
jgi:hypothetical protein